MKCDDFIEIVHNKVPLESHSSIKNTTNGDLYLLLVKCLIVVLLFSTLKIRRFFSDVQLHIKEQCSLNIELGEHVKIEFLIKNSILDLKNI